MPSRSRLYHLALGGCLGALLFCAPSLAQQNVQEPPPPVNESEGIAAQSPPPKEDSAKSADRQQTPPAESLPSLAAQKQDTAEPACGPRCQEAKDREEADLKAQQSMADSAATMIGLTWWQLYVGGAGIGLLIVTLILTIRSTDAAVDANRIARKTARQELRAYVSLTPAGVSYKRGKLRIHVCQRNAGQTPAQKVRFSGVVQLLDFPLPNDFEFPEPVFTESINVVHPDTKFSVPVEFVSEITRRRLEAIGPIQNRRPYFIGTIVYEDIFKEEHRTHACWSHDLLLIGTLVSKIERLTNEATEVPFDYTANHNCTD